MVVELCETDSAGNTTGTYLLSENERVDLVLPPRNGPLTKRAWESTLAAFLPVGYPHSVTSDYTRYQIFDSLQAFCSSIAGLLASRAVLEGVGVGDSSASPTAALLLTILQDSAGRIGTILFAHRLGTALEPECKMWRLAADVFNDTAMIIDCLSPAFPRTQRVLLLSASSTLRALCGVAAGSAKASLSAHFAKWGNLGELNAKDSSQETVISLIGMLAGSFVVGYVTTPRSTWICLLFLLAAHLMTNYAAVRAVSMRTLNRQRANIVFSNWIDHGVLLKPEEVSQQEAIFERDGVLRWKRGPVLARVRVGISLNTLMRTMKKSKRSREIGHYSTKCPGITELLAYFVKERYILWYSPEERLVLIVLRDDSGKTQLKAWAHSLLLVQSWQSVKDQEKCPDLSEMLRQTLKTVDQTWSELAESLAQAGWDIDIASIETTEGTRLPLST